jgi:hypothetical protein
MGLEEEMKRLSGDLLVSMDLTMVLSNNIDSGISH